MKCCSTQEIFLPLIEGSMHGLKNYNVYHHKITATSTFIITSGFATTHVVVSVRHPITYQSPPTPTNLANTLKNEDTGENKIDR